MGKMDCNINDRTEEYIHVAVFFGQVMELSQQTPTYFSGLVLQAMSEGLSRQRQRAQWHNLDVTGRTELESRTTEQSWEGSLMVGGGLWDLGVSVGLE